MSVNHEKIVNQLKRRIKYLENELCERTRNYLMHKGIKNGICKERNNQSVQTEVQSSSKNNLEYLTSFSPLLSSPQKDQQQSLQKESNRNIFKKIDVSGFLDEEMDELHQKKIKIGEILQRLIEEQSKKEQESCQTSVNDDTFLSESSFTSNQNYDHNKERRRLKRQIKKLNSKLEFQKKINLFAKEGLLISEEENYQFRLRIKELQKSKGINLNEEQHNHFDEVLMENTRLKQQINKLLSFVENEKNEKDYEMQRIFSQNADINKIQIEKSIKNRQVVFEQVDYLRKGQLIDKQIMQQLKQISFSISNCIPITSQFQDVNYFKPENEVQVIEVLKRVQNYCKDIEKWQLERIELINKEKMLFVNFIKRICSNIDRNTKKKLSQEIITIDSMVHFLYFLKNSENEVDISNINEFEKQPGQFQKKKI